MIPAISFFDYRSCGLLKRDDTDFINISHREIKIVNATLITFPGNLTQA
jgi:hypothetical protein